MKIKGPVDKSIQKHSQYICNWHGRHNDKASARRAWRRSLNQITYELQKDPELFDEEPWDVDGLSSWDVW